MRTTYFIPLVGLALLWPDAVDAQVCEPAMEPESTQNNLQYLRRLSLDLLGQLPDVAQQYEVMNSGSVDPSLIDTMIGSEALIEQVRAYHRDLLWTNLQGLRLTNNIWILQGPGGRGARSSPAYWSASAGRALLYRGAQVGCLDEPAQFDEVTGEILTTPNENDPNIQQEGWVEIEPYWAPGTTVQVCAFDAQDNLMGTNARGQQIDCSRSTAPNCGCGPNLRWCQSQPNQTMARIIGSLNEQLLRFMDQVVREGRPYSDILVGKDIELNGPIVHWLRYQVQTAGGRLPAITEQNHPLPEVSFDQIDNWTSVQRTGRHAGVLSMAGYLLKFQSNRGRANRFYNAFLCQHFEATNPLPPASDPCHAEPDLTERCGCSDCHVALEPAAGYWGRWAEAGLLPMDETLFPTFNPSCTGPQAARNPACSFFYFTQNEVTDPERESEYVGMLRAYVFASEQTQANIADGPEALARSAIDSGAFASCTVNKMWNQLMTRAPSKQDEATVSSLTEAFKADYDLRGLIRLIVELPEYKRAGRFGEEN